MNIQFNNQKHQIPAGSLLQLVLNNLIGLKQKGIAVAINDTVVPRQNWSEQILLPDDNVLVITATQGG